MMEKINERLFKNREPEIEKEKLQWKGKMPKLEAVPKVNFHNDNGCKDEHQQKSK